MKKLILIVTMGIVMLGCKNSSGSEDMKNKVAVGKKAPDFTLKDSQDNDVSLSDFKGKKVVFYFFPKAETPNCTTEACAFRDSNELYQQKDIAVIGASYDNPKTLAEFKQKHHLPFILVSDSDRKVATQYGAYKTFLNKLFPERMTFLIDENGILIDILTEINVSKQAQDILDIFSKS